MKTLWKCPKCNRINELDTDACACKRESLQLIEDVSSVLISVTESEYQRMMQE
jgi:hypothetical protein